MFWNRLQGPELKCDTIAMVQAHNSGCLNQGGFGGVGREEVRFWTLLKIVLTGVKENSKFIGLSNWEDGVIGMGKFVGGCLGAGISLLSDMLSLRRVLETFKWRW